MLYEKYLELSSHLKKVLDKSDDEEMTVIDYCIIEAALLESLANTYEYTEVFSEEGESNTVHNKIKKPSLSVVTELQPNSNKKADDVTPIKGS